MSDVARGAAERSPAPVDGLGDVPDARRFVGDVYRPLGVDVEGTVYWIVERGDSSWSVVETDGSFPILGSTRIRHEKLPGFVDHVGESVGWRDLDQEWLERAGELAGGESA